MSGSRYLRPHGDGGLALGDRVFSAFVIWLMSIALLGRDFKHKWRKALFGSGVRGDIIYCGDLMISFEVSRK
ncbi:MAG: hypothetical protein CL912_18735 [Deltaproteobacteria bacterium]|nr:hypothetical protein [Deltaproteobacteria bacterium]